MKVIKMKVIIKKCESLSDWYEIVRAEHDDKEWFEETGPNSSSYCWSGRLIPTDASIEGTSQHMLGIANAIQRRGQYTAKRCAVFIEKDGVYLWSPRNSGEWARITIDEADELASQIISMFST